MSKKVTISVPVEVTVRDRDMRLLAAVTRLAAGSESETRASIGRLSAETDSSVDTVRRAVRSCVASGYLVVMANSLENGTRQENTYALTGEGRRILAAARAAGVVS